VATLEVGRVCMKIAGREAGRYACVLKKLDNTFVLITGPKILTGVKRRRCNVDHLEPTPYSLRIKEEASDAEVIKAYEEAGLLKKLGLKLPHPGELKEVGIERVKEKKVKPKKVEVEKKEKKEEKLKKAKAEKKPEVKKEKKGITIKLKIPALKKKPKKEKEKKKEVKKVKKPKKEAKPKKKAKKTKKLKKKPKK